MKRRVDIGFEKSRPVQSVILAAAIVGSFGLAAGQAAADGASRANLAPPGPCAEPRVAAGASDSASSFAVIGPVSALFNPQSVSAQPAPRLQGPPVAAATTRPGPCDEPGASCRGDVTPVSLPTPPTNPPVIPGGRPGN